MKKLLFVLFLFFTFSVQSFATTTIERIDVTALEKGNVILDSDSDKVLSADEMKNNEKYAEENTKCETCCPSSNCGIISITCPCGVGFLVQYCSGGCCPHPPLIDWVSSLCQQACPPQV